eukprot:12613729-Alexandrium_andersonii.AAC.1
MSASLVGSEMCIRDSFWGAQGSASNRTERAEAHLCLSVSFCHRSTEAHGCLLYTSDAADDM